MASRMPPGALSQPTRRPTPCPRRPSAAATAEAEDTSTAKNAGNRERSEGAENRPLFGGATGRLPDEPCITRKDILLTPVYRTGCSARRSTSGPSSQQSHETHSVMVANPSLFGDEPWPIDEAGALQCRFRYEGRLSRFDRSRWKLETRQSSGLYDRRRTAFLHPCSILFLRVAVLRYLDGSGLAGYRIAANRK